MNLIFSRSKLKSYANDLLLGDRLNWDEHQSKRLRKILNWTPKQIASRLGLDDAFYIRLEAGEEAFSSEICFQLDLLKNLVNQHSQRIHRQPIVDELLKQNGVDQLDNSEIDDCFLELDL